MYVIGTAGHVDHGKSTLIEALTGIDPDRLAEEKERALTIDLGFAWMQLEVAGELEEVGIVDVPGHRDFIENMLAGIGGIDLALFVVAADEGVMPQTTEHLAIIDLLEVSGGVVALTKVDLIDDTDWLELVTLDLHENLAGTVLEDAPIIPVSAQTGEGLSQLQAELGARLAATEARPDLGRPRLAIDRVFTLSGFGTIVTGTLTGGRLKIGDEVEIQPGGMQGRVRGLQTHKTAREETMPGSRVAVNVSGIDAGEVKRGQVLAHSGQARSTVLLDASYRHLATAQKPLKHNVEVKLFVGAAEVMARTRVVGSRAIDPGQTGWLQLALQEPVVAQRGDHYILRRPSPGATLGGGLVLDPHPGRRHRRFQERVVDRLQTLAQGTPQDVLLQKLERLQPIQHAALFQKAGLADDVVQEAWEALRAEDEVVLLGQNAVTASHWSRLRQQTEKHVSTYHKQYPLRTGIPREELRNRLNLSAPVFNALVQQMVQNDGLVDTGSTVHHRDHQIQFDDDQEKAIDALLNAFERAGVDSPSAKESKSQVGEDVYQALLELGKLRQLNEDVVYRTADLERLTKQIVSFIEVHESASAAEIRDLLGTSRKYAIALLEDLDQRRITRRVGDQRVLVGRATKGSNH
ncbi:MAG: selenocysteine-specific translation elongation factor [Chloroflexota bacterium]